MKSSRIIRILSSALAVLTVAAVFPIFVSTVHSQDATPGIRYEVEGGDALIMGYSLLTSDEELLPEGLEWAYDYINGDVKIVDYTGRGKELIIPAFINGHPVTKIGNSAFYDCRTLEIIVLPEGIKHVGNYAFNDCVSLESLNIPASVTSIGIGITGGCSSLVQMTVDTENTVYHSDQNCIVNTEEKTVVAGCKESLIPSDGSVTAIGKYAFYNCTLLEHISIPEAVTAIGDSAFYCCYGLDKVYYCGSREQWNDVTIGTYNEDLLNAAIVFTKGIIIGDVDGDTKLTSIDSNMLKRLVAGAVFFEAASPALYAADVNGDGDVNSIDANLLKRKIAGV